MTSSQVNVSETPPMSASDLEGLKEGNGLYAGKFKTVEDLVGSYKELEGKLGAIDQTREEPEGVAEEETEEQETETNDSEFDAEEFELEFDSEFELLLSALDKSNVKKEIKKQLIKKVFEFLLQEKNLINLFSITFCKIKIT